MTPQRTTEMRHYLFWGIAGGVVMVARGLLNRSKRTNGENAP